MTQTMASEKGVVSAELARRWKPYPAYKDSGVEWLGEVPEHWEKKKLKYLVSSDPNSLVDGPFGSDLKNEEYKDDGVPLIQLNNILDGKHALQNMKYISEEKAKDLARHIIWPGHIVIAKMADPVARAACVSDAYPKYVIVADCVKFNPNNYLAHTPFLIYAINSPYVRYKAELLSTGTTRLRINLGSIKNLPLFLPPLPEQHAITSFLDRQTAHLNALISKKECLIALLEEKRAALISSAVTKGLEPNVPMKDSGVEWLGKVPERWEVKRLKYIAPLSNNKLTEKPDELLYLGLEQVESKTGRLLLDVMVENVESIVSVFKKRDVLFSKLRPYLAKVVYTEFNGVCTSELLVLKPNSTSDGKFLFYRLISDDFINLVDSMTYGTKMPRASSEQIANVSIPLPAVSEQRAIASFLECETAKIAALIAKIRDGIVKMREYRTALISSAVTGKIDVREVV